MSLLMNFGGLNGVWKDLWPNSRRSLSWPSTLVLWNELRYAFLALCVAGNRSVVML